jgi:beta-phosphoglucomutase-like phosphatase (HAD superfamily)
MHGMLEVVAFACRGTLVDWTGAIEAVTYELARRNGESPLDRGAMLRRRVEALADGRGLAYGFERLAREQRYRVGTDGDDLLAGVVAAARPLPGGGGSGARVRPARARRVAW